jgi:hypothetical protein
MPKTFAIYRNCFSHNMARYKPQDRNSLLLPVVLSEQIVPGSFAFGKRPAAPPTQQRNQLLACKGQELIDLRVQAGGQFVQSLL